MHQTFVIHLRISHLLFVICGNQQVFWQPLMETLGRENEGNRGDQTHSQNCCTGLLTCHSEIVYYDIL